MPDTTDNAKLVEETVNIFAPAEAKRALDELRAALASANALNKRLVAGLTQAATNLSDAADRIFKIGKVLSEVSDKLGGDAGFESSSTQVLAAAAIVRQYEAEARALLADMGKGDGG